MLTTFLPCNRCLCWRVLGNTIKIFQTGVYSKMPRAHGPLLSGQRFSKELEDEKRRNIEIDIKHISGEKGRRARWQTPVIHPPDVWWSVPV
jgi:hypothetical protein